jgi:hypothetical protein
VHLLKVLHLNILTATSCHWNSKNKASAQHLCTVRKHHYVLQVDRCQCIYNCWSKESACQCECHFAVEANAVGGACGR